MQFIAAVFGLAALASAQMSAPYPVGNATVPAGTGAPGTAPMGTGSVPTVIATTFTNSQGVVTSIATITPSSGGSGGNGGNGGNGNGGATGSTGTTTGGAPLMTAAPGVAALIGGAAYLLL